MSDQATDRSQTADNKFVPIEISQDLLHKLIDKESALKALNEQAESLHDNFWEEVCESYGLDRDESWTLDKQYIESGVVMLKKRECVGCDVNEMPDSLKQVLKRVLFDGAGTDDVKEVPGAN